MSNADPNSPERVFKRRVVVTFVRFYLLGYLVAMPLLQWRFINNEGFGSWLIAGFIIPLFEALLWPVQLAGWLLG